MAIATAVAVEAAVVATDATREDIEAIWCRKQEAMVKRRVGKTCFPPHINMLE